MNKNRFRTIFNAVRGVMMVVAENVKSHTASASSSTNGSQPKIVQSASHQTIVTIRPLAFSIMLALGLVSIVPNPININLAHADIIVDHTAPASQQAIILNAPNGVPLVNIQTPSPAGVSRNTYSQFDVNANGAILNNSRTNVQTQLGGYVQDNPYLATGSARIILNEVNSQNPSLLNGYVEVAGSSAQVVIANPAGISCNGCGFINASRATLTTGTPMLNGGDLIGYRVTGGIINILGAGLDASQTNYTDIIARAVNVNAGVWVQNLNVTTGANQVSVDTSGNANSTAAIAGTGSIPTFAIDVAALGGMYAGKIHLIGTEAGVGVRNAGAIGASVGEISIDVNGMLTNTATGLINSSQDTQIQASSGISNAGTVYAGGNSTLTTQGNLENTGTIAALANTILSADGANSHINSTATSVLAAGLKTDGTLGTTGNLSITASQSLTAQGQNLAAVDQSITAQSLDLSASNSAGRNLKFTASNGNLNAANAAINASNTLTANTTQILTTDAARVSAQQLNLTAHDISNIAGELIQTGTGDTSINLAGNLNNDQGRIATNANNLTLTAQTLTNTSSNGKTASIEHAGTGMLKVSATTLNGTGGLIQSNGVLDLTVGTATLDNGSTISKQINIGTTTLSNKSGKIIQTGTDAASINASIKLDNTNGTIAGNGTTTLIVGDLINQSGSIQAAGTSNLTVNATGSIDNSALNSVAANIKAGGSATLTATSLNNSQGQITAGNILSATITQGIDNSQGLLAANQALTINGLSVNNTSGTIASVQAGVDLTATSGSINNTLGHITAAQTLNTNNQGLNNTDGTLLANSMAVNSQSQAFDNTRGSIISTSIISTSSLDLQTGALTNDAGLIQSGSSMTINTHGQTLTNINSGTTKGILSQGTASLTTADLNNRSGYIGAKGVLTANSAAITNNTGGVITSETTIALNGSSLDNQTGRVEALGNVDINIGSGAANSINNQSGLLRSGQTLTLTAGSINNSNTQASNQGIQAQYIAIAASSINNTAGKVSAFEDVTLNVHTLIGDGSVFAGRDASLNLQGDYTQTAANQIMANHDLSITLTGNLSNSGTLAAINNLSLNAANINNQGSLGAGAQFTAHTATLSNSGSIVGADIAIAATQEIDNVGPNALIGATSTTGKLELLAPVITNRDDTTGTDTPASTTIYGLGQLVLAGRKDASGNYINATRILNQSGLIESGTDMLIAADTLTNTRRDLQMSNTFTQVGSPVSGSLHNGEPRTDVAAPRPDPAAIGGVPPTPPMGGSMNSTYTQTNYTQTTSRNSILSISPKAEIIAGGNLTPMVGLLQNYWSSVNAAGNISLNNVTLDQDSWRGATPYLERSTYDGNYQYRNYKGVVWYIAWPAPQTIDTPIAGYDSSFTAQGNIAGTGNTIQNTAAGSSHTPLGTAANTSIYSVSNPNATTQVAAVTTSQSAPATVAHTASPNIMLPNSSLYHVNPASANHYLIASDPRFTDYKTWLSSDYMLSALSYDPATTTKRLGDGFYEQKLIREQINQLTGRRFLAGYSGDESEYQVLMNNGVNYARQYNLRPGIALTAAQMNALTSDIVWLVEKTVTLADGSTQQVLAPQVYLRPQSTLLTDTGSLIAANNIDLTDLKGFNNSGTLQADNNLSLSGQTLDNRGGNLQSGGLMTLNSAGDIDLTSAQVKAGSLQLQTGGDLKLNTGVRQITTTGVNGTRSSSQVGRIASIDVAGNTRIGTAGNFEQNGATLKTGGNLTTNIQGNWQIGTAQYTESTQVQRNGGHSNTDAVKNITSQVQVGGVSDIQVGNNLTATGADINLQGGGTVAVGGNLTLNAAKDSNKVDASSSGSSSGRSYAETNKALDEKVLGTTLSGGKDLTLQAGKDITMTGSDLTLTAGQASLIAQGDVTINSATELHQLDTTHSGKHSNLLSSKATSEINHIDNKTAVGSSVSADSITVQSGKDLNVQGSNVVATNDVNLNAANNINITAAQNMLDETHFKDVKTSGLMSSGGIGFTVGKRQLTTTNDGQQVTNTASMVGSIAGNVNINSGKTYTQTGSDVLAPKGDINIAAQQVNIVAAEDTNNSQQTTKFKQSGLTVAVTSPVISAVQTAQQMSQAASQTKDTRMQALAAGTAALAAKNAADALIAGNTPQLDGNGLQVLDANGNNTAQNPANQVGGINLNISLGSSQSSSNSNQSSTNTASSHVTAGNNVNIIATGAGKESDINVIPAGGIPIDVSQKSGNINVTGSQVKAGNDVALTAQHNINLTAAQNTSTQNGTNKSSSGSIGVSVGTGGFAVTASASKGKGNSNGTDTTYTDTQIQGGNKAGSSVILNSGTDTSLIGAQVTGNQVIANVGTNPLTGGNLNIQSLQDTSSYQAKQNSSGFSISVPIGAGAIGGNISLSKSNTNSNYASVNEQSGIMAGDGGFQVTTQGNTNLIGAVIASTDKAIQDNKNSLATQTLTISNLENKADYKADSMGVSVGGGTQSGKTTLTGAGIGSDSGNANSVTVSGISQGVVNITNSNQQEALAGKSAVTTVALLNRDVTVNKNGEAVDSQGISTAHTIAPIFDKQKVAREIQAQTQITQAFSQQAPVALATFAADKIKPYQDAKKVLEDAKVQLATETDPNKQEQLQNIIIQSEQKVTENQDAYDKWKANGSYRIASNIIIAAISGGTTGAVGAVTQESLSWAADQMRQNMIKDSMKFLGICDAKGNCISNMSGKSVGANGDNTKLAGGRVILADWCSKGACEVDTSTLSGYKENADGTVIFKPVDANGNNLTISQFMEQNPEMRSPLGGHQGDQGQMKLLGIQFDYAAGSFWDKLAESFAGTHDTLNSFIWYDNLGNGKKLDGTLIGQVGDVTNMTNVPLASTFALSVLLPPEIWNSVFAAIKVTRP